MYSSNLDHNTPRFSRNHWNSVWNQNSSQNYPIQQSSNSYTIGKNNGYREFSHSPSPICPEYTTTNMIQQDLESKEQNHQEAKKPPRIPTGVEELLDSYTYKKAKRFVNNCDREHPSPQPLPEKPEKVDIAVPTVTQVSGIFALYQVVRVGNFSKTAKNCFPELFPDYLEFLNVFFKFGPQHTTILSKSLEFGLESKFVSFQKILKNSKTLKIQYFRSQNYPIQQSSNSYTIGKNNGYREFSHSPSPICPEYTTTNMIQQDLESKEQNHQEAKKPPRIPTGVEELLDSYTYKKAKRFVNNCDREHPSPQPLPEKPEKVDIAVPTVTQVSGIFALYQVVRVGNFSKTAKNCFPELFPDYLEFLTINQESILSNYRFSSVPSLLIGDILAVKWAWLNSEIVVAGEFQILERKISINRFFLPINRFEGVAYGIEGTVGLLYPKDTMEIHRGTVFEPFEVGSVGKCAPLIIGELAGNLKNPEMEELIFFENWQIFLVKHRQFFSTVSQGKSIIESIYSPEAPPLSRPRNSQKLLEKFLESMRKMDFLTEFQKTWTTRMLQRNPLVLGITVENIYSNLAISAYCMAQKWLGTHLVLAENSRKSMEIFENLLEISKGSKLKIRRYDYSNPNYSNPENYSNPDILITDCSSILKIQGKLENVKSVQFDRIFGIPNEILGSIFVEFCDSWSFGFMENLEKIPENSGISGISGRFETAIIGGKFEILDVRKDLDMDNLGF